MPSQYLQHVAAIRRQNPQVNDVERGLQAGESIGKLLGGLGDAIKGAQKDQLANQLMTQQSISDQPNAGQTQDLGTLSSDDSDGAQAVSDDSLRQAMAAQNLGSSGQPQDLGYDPSFTNPATSDIQPVQDPNADTDFQSAIAAARLGGSGPTVGSVGPQPGGPQPNAQPPNTLAQRSADGSWNLSGPNGFSGAKSVGEGAFPGGGGSGTVGGLIGTGGVQALTLQQEMAKQKLANQKAVAAQQMDALDLADRQAKISGTGQYALDTAKKRADLAKTQLEITNYGKTKPDKNPPAQNIASEPVIDQGQLVNHFEGTYGKGSFSDVMNNLDQVDTKTSPGFAIIGPSEKPVAKIPIGDAQTFVKQQNALRIKQGLSPFQVPGEDQSQGATAANPYPAKNNLDVYSRPPGTWVRLPNGKLAQVPGR